MGSTDGGWETWRWDESLFAGSAPYYERGRFPYAPGLADVFAEALGLDGGGRLLDVGCGPGVVALRLAHLFEEVVGLDPDAGMIAAAAEAARERDVTNVVWVQERAEALPAGLREFQVVTFAASFHWMDRTRVAAAVRQMVPADGAVVQIDAPAYRSDELLAETERRELPHPPPPDGAVEALRQHYLGRDKRAGQTIRNTSPSGEDAIFVAAGFRPCVEVAVPDGRVLERSIDDLVAMRFSSSGTAPHLFGDRLPQFEAGLRATLAAASPSGLFSVRLPDNSIRIWRPAK